jgi:hypothetical protein
MDLNNIEGMPGYTALKISRDERTLIERAANATIIAMGAVRRSRFLKRKIEPTPSERQEKTSKIMAIGGIVRRLAENRPPVFAKPVEEGIAISVGEEGSTIVDAGELSTLNEVLGGYAEATGSAAPTFTKRGGLDTSAWQRASYGGDANALSSQITDHLASQQ